MLEILNYDILLTKKLQILTNGYICWMRLFKSLFEFYVFGNIHVAVAGFCLTTITIKRSGFNDLVSPLFVGLSIVLSYNFIRFYQIPRNRMSRRKDWFLKNKTKLYVLFFLAFTGMTYLILDNDFNLKTLLLILTIGILTFFYVVPFLKNSGRSISIRSIPSIKIFSIAFSWTVMTVIFPLLYNAQLLNLEVLVAFVQRFVFLVVILIPFDIRDFDSDLPELKTLPQVFGIHGAKLIGFALLGVFVLPVFLKFQETNTQTILIVALITAILLWNSSPQRNKYYTCFWVESLPIFWFLLEIVHLKI